MLKKLILKQEMKLTNKFILLSILILWITIFLGLRFDLELNKNHDVPTIGKVSQTTAPSIQLYNYLIKYSEKHRVPKEIVFGVAKAETGYKGMFDWNYNPKQISYANAIGAMQIQLATANDFSTKKITKQDLLNNHELNIDLGIKILAHLKKKHGSWSLALGAYNTGRPIINDYAKKILNEQRTKK